MRPAFFLDRDGTIIEHVHHLHRVEDVRLVPGAAAAIARARRSGYLAIVVTNQSVVGRGLVTAAGLEEIHGEMGRQLVAANPDALIDALYWNPHLPEASGEQPHPDRKPGPGMLLQAAVEHEVDLARSWMVGDSLSDTEAGRRAGCAGSVLVRTGLGGHASKAADPGTPVVGNLAEAIDFVLRSGGSLEAARRSSELQGESP